MKILLHRRRIDQRSLVKSLSFVVFEYKFIIRKKKNKKTNWDYASKFWFKSQHNNYYVCVINVNRYRSRRQTDQHHSFLECYEIKIKSLFFFSKIITISISFSFSTTHEVFFLNKLKHCFLLSAFNIIHSKQHCFKRILQLFKIPRKMILLGEYQWQKKKKKILLSKKIFQLSWITKDHFCQMSKDSINKYSSPKWIFQLFKTFTRKLSSLQELSKITREEIISQNNLPAVKILPIILFSKKILKI